MTDAETQGSYSQIEFLGHKNQRHWKKFKESTCKRDGELLVRTYFRKNVMKRQRDYEGCLNMIDPGSDELEENPCDVSECVLDCF